MNINLTEILKNDINDVYKNVYRSCKIRKYNSELDKVEVEFSDFIRTLPKKYQGVAEELFEKYIMTFIDIEFASNQEFYKKGIKRGIELQL